MSFKNQSKSSESPSSILSLARAAVFKEQVVAAATDTLVGLLALATSSRAAARVLEIKGPTRKAPMPVLLPNLEAVLEISENFPPEARRLAERYWPGPLTLVLIARPSVFPPEVTAGGPTVGVRVPGPSPALDLLQEVQEPLTGTSANLSGLPPADRVELLSSEIVSSVKVVLAGMPGSGEASAIVDCTRRTPRLIRPGPGIDEFS